jgi:pimeloyl-ACP methyl ester carboxylesterase
MRLVRFTLLTLLLAGLAGCADLGAVQVNSDQPHVGNVYIVRGLIGIWSLGMDDLAEELRAQGVRAIVYQDTQTGALARQIATTYRGVSGAEPLILVGHSLGADDVVYIAKHLNEEHVPVDLLITLDPVSPSDITPNVRWAVNFYKSSGIGIPIFRGVPLTAVDPAATRLDNLDLRNDHHDLDPEGKLGHFNIDDSEVIRAEAIRRILTVATLRQGRPSTRPQGRPPA